ncbi:MAG: T9SS type A sorting domain-containing protein [Sphingobacteriales bacterium]|nr:T9SS type A sorting domain-containing protein [Sphingobacteriales bacterium]
MQSLKPCIGLTYYRLTEIDANNQKTIQGVISVMRSKAQQNSLAISQVSTDANQQNLTLYLQKPNANTLANIQILSTQGQIVQTGQTHHAVWQTDIAHLPSGLYLLIAEVNGEVVTKKIVINR